MRCDIHRLTAAGVSVGLGGVVVRAGRLCHHACTLRGAVFIGDAAAAIILPTEIKVSAVASNP